MTAELVYRVALTLIPNLGTVHAKILLQHMEPEEIFHAKRSFLEKIEGIGSVRAESILNFTDFEKAEKEIRFMEKSGIRPLFITDKDYPSRLLNCYDSPTLLYYKGEANLNAQKTVAVIGTRSHSDYGRHSAENLVNKLAEKNILIISGLAFGIDAIAHKAALKFNTPTVAVLAHGLDQVYPADHSGLAREIVSSDGGILTEFRSKIDPDRHNFPARNRIVAGMSDATIVIESDVKGGSIITAELANSYNRDVFAIPGRINDPKSSGCNQLIRNNKAVLLNNAQELFELMGWEERSDVGSRRSEVKQRELFIELSKEEKVIVELLRINNMHIDEINFRSGMSNSAVASLLLNLELQNVIRTLPGKLYTLN